MTLLVAERSAEIARRAGTAKAIKVVKSLLVKRGAVTAIANAVKEYALTDAAHKEATGACVPGCRANNSVAETAKGATAKVERKTDEAPKTEAEKMASSLLDKAGVPLPKPRMPKAEDKKAGPTFEAHGLSDELAASVAFSLLSMATEPESRGQIVQQGALKLLVRLCEHPKEKCRDDAALAIARICITTDPHLFPQEGLALSLIRPLLSFLKRASHELFLFEVRCAVQLC